MEQEFFRAPDLFEKETVVDFEKTHYKKETRAGNRIIIFMVAIIAVCIWYALFSKTTNPEQRGHFAFLIIPAIIYIVVVLRSIIIGKRHLSKVLNGMYSVQTVTVLGKTKTNDNGKDSNRISLESEDGFMYAIYVDDGLSKKMPTNMKGLLVLITGEKSLLFNDKYRFIPNVQYNSNVNLTANEFLTPNDSQHSRVLRSFDNRFNKNKISLALCSFSFFAGFVLLLVASFFSRPASLVLNLCSMGLLIVPGIYLSAKVIKQVYSGVNGLMIVWAVWLTLSLFDFVLASGLVMPGMKTIQYLAIGIGFVLDILAELFFFRDVLSNLKMIRNRAYSVSDVVIASKDFSVMPSGYSSVIIYTIVAITSFDHTYKISNVSQDQFNRVSEGDKVLLIKPNGNNKSEKLYIVE